MALVARHAVSHRLPAPRSLVTSTPRLPRLSVRAFGVGSAALFLVLLIDAMLNPRAFFDVSAMQAVQATEIAGLETGITAVNDVTSSTGAVATWAIVLIGLVALRWWLPALGVMTLPAGGIINYVVGEFLVARTRPHLAELERVSQNPEERSFPSGHVMGAVMLYGFLFVVARRIPYRPLRLIVQGGSLAVIAMVGFARVWSGAHWPTDVLGAYALGGLLLAMLIGVYQRLDAAVGSLPFVHAAVLPHDEARPHAHALTSLVLFNGDSVAKVYTPGFVPRALYWLAFQAPFPYVANRAALDAAMHRRNLAGLLTAYWFGSSRVARATGVVEVDNHLALVSEFVHGGAPTDRKAAKAFLRELRARFEEAGLPTWQIDPRQPRAIDNLLETADGAYKVVDLESGLVSPLASLRTWGRAVRRGLVPFYDEVFFDVTRAYVAREEAAMRVTLGDERFAELVATLDAAETAAVAWHATEPRLWGRFVRGVLTGFGVRTWRTRAQARLANSHERGVAWIDRAITTWEREDRITSEEAATLREQVAAPTFQAMLPYLGAHIIVSVPLRFPLGSIVRPLMVLGALGVAGWRRLRGGIDRDAWRVAWSIHSPLVVVLSAVPGFGSFAYLAAKPVRANRLLLRAVTDAACQKVPWRLYERSNLRRFVARPVPSSVVAAPIWATAKATAAPVAVERSHAAPSWWLVGDDQLAPAECWD